MSDEPEDRSQALVSNTRQLPARRVIVKRGIELAISLRADQRPSAGEANTEQRRSEANRHLDQAFHDLNCAFNAYHFLLGSCPAFAGGELARLVGAFYGGVRAAAVWLGVPCEGSIDDVARALLQKASPTWRAELTRWIHRLDAGTGIDAIYGSPSERDLHLFLWEVSALVNPSQLSPESPEVQHLMSSLKDSLDRLSLRQMDQSKGPLTKGRGSSDGYVELHHNQWISDTELIVKMPPPRPESVPAPTPGAIPKGTVIRWLKTVGDWVEPDTPLFEMSTDEGNVVIIPASVYGILTEIRVKEGETVPIFRIVGVISRRCVLSLPGLGENIEGGEVLRLFVAPGETLVKDQRVLELKTAEAFIEIPSSIGGRVRVKDLKVKPGDKIEVGQPILIVEELDPDA
jgi:hypothetical protein